VLRASTSFGISAIVEVYRSFFGAGRMSFVGSDRFASTDGVGEICPKPSGRNGNGVAPTTHVGAAGTVVVAEGAGDGAAGGAELVDAASGAAVVGWVGVA